MKAKKPAAAKPPKANKPEDLGVRCPSCHCRHCPVAYTRQQRNTTIRVRDCRYCGRRFRTKEQAAGTDL